MSIDLCTEEVVMISTRRATTSPGSSCTHQIDYLMYGNEVSQ